MGVAFYFIMPESLLYLKKEFMNWVNFLHVDSDAIMLG